MGSIIDNGSELMFTGKIDDFIDFLIRRTIILKSVKLILVAQQFYLECSLNYH